MLKTIARKYIDEEKVISKASVKIRSIKRLELAKNMWLSVILKSSKRTASALLPGLMSYLR